MRKEEATYKKGHNYKAEYEHELTKNDNVSNLLQKLDRENERLSDELEETKNKLSQLENDYDVLEKTNKFINDMAEKQSKELGGLKKDITRFLYLQTGRMPFTGGFTQTFIIENKSYPLEYEYITERDLQNEYKNLKAKLELVGKDDE